MVNVINIKMDSGDDIECEKCGNEPNREGFDTCDKQGIRMEPTIESSWEGHYVCNKCGTVYHVELTDL